ncbi:MAG: 16S rRNA (adenine(1518)-N(6)/adenine(1519)-N(6))-dimethyltransferase RsmA [Rhodospirillales bacterium]|nr:16S rRNA (adenine(1518)-N(6)/adenine(1519)-N(6))-dimethyltransferase RsmA [Rhodospirillales bacterium]MCY4004076.1 16S rRNA (adenine(1518)-N(6)/adenine(1519)-N(6))-dimethyltransferase RsmA [Rhodospirillales bacterium]MDE0373577.1 16S rRNA (adenine(1518)-N(6)/adenine(1519)-N(6))-dimethyltransferase RsmA [Rhodospirillales bacterium]
MGGADATIAALPAIRDVVAAAGIAPRKSFGQHFLFDLNVAARIARAAGDLSSGTVVEVGPGPGALTRGLLLAGAKRVVAIERDARCVVALQGLIQAAPGRLSVIEADARGRRLEDCGEPPVRVVANLPYGIASRLLVDWLPADAGVKGFTLMFQREVAQRITAAPGTSAYGRLSVLVQWAATARILFSIPPGVFVPPPQVHSAVVEIIPRRSTETDGPTVEDLRAVVRLAFGQRRKMLRSSLAALGDPEALLAQAGIAADRRAGELSVAEFARLAKALGQRGVRYATSSR